MKNKTKSGVAGVYPYNGSWQVSISVNGKEIYLGIYDTISEAVDTKEKYLAIHKRERKTTAKTKSGIIGVYPYNNQWKVQLRKNNKDIYLGVYDTIEEAKAAKEQYLATGEGKNRVRAKSGIKGIYQVKDRWQVQIRKNGKNISLGVYDTIEEAAAAKEKYLKEQK